jgi:hypothetical protein
MVNNVIFLQEHVLRPLLETPYYESKKGTSTRAKRACVVCKKKTAYYCAGCSKPDQNLFVCLCNPANKSPEGYLSCVTTYHEGEPVA